MPRPRFDRADPEKKNAVLDAAAEELALYGFEGASLNRILAAAGLSKGAFYYYFDDKADLAAAVLARECAGWITAFAHMPLPATAEAFWEEISRLQDEAMAQMRESPKRGDLLFRLAAAIRRHPELMAHLEPFMQQAGGALGAFFERGQKVGAVRSDLPLGVLIAILQGAKQAVSTAMLPADRSPSPEELAEFARVNLDCLRRLAEPRPGSAAAAEEGK
jgi:AcrR family transcriptional regulator